jgi:hypothetical protein
MLAKTVILIKEAWMCDTGSGEERPCKEGVGGKILMSRRIWVVWPVSGHKAREKGA